MKQTMLPLSALFSALNNERITADVVEYLIKDQGLNLYRRGGYSL